MKLAEQIRFELMRLDAAADTDNDAVRRSVIRSAVSKLRELTEHVGKLETR